MQICGGEEINIGLVDGILQCEASSTLEGRNCDSAFLGAMVDNEEGMWASNGESIGAWIYVRFRRKYAVTRFEYKNRDNSGERNNEIEVSYEDGSSTLYGFKNTDKITPVEG